MKYYLTDLAMSRKLKEAGIRKESKFTWFNGKTHYGLNEWRLVNTGMLDLESPHCISAYLLSELLGMVEGFVNFHEDKSIIDVTPNHQNTQYFDGENSVQAVAKAILWQKEQDK